MNTVCRRVAQIALVCAVLSLVGLEAQAQTYVFGNASYSAPGLNSTSPPQGNAAISTADFNGDGIPDVVILGLTSGGQVLSIFLGRPDGSFAPRVDYSVQATGFTVGDFNGDGKLDVIVVTYGYTVTGSILLGNGDGTLQPPVPLNQNIGNGYSAAVSGDFNGDGKLDLLLLTPDFGSGATMAILLGNGDGSFQASVTYSVPVAPYIVLGDFNHDGKPDIAISGGISGSGEVSMLPSIPFDPMAYGIPPASLIGIEPVQLLALHVAQQALRDAGYAERNSHRERTSVIFGAEAGSDLAAAYNFRATFRSYFGELPPELDEGLPELTEGSFPGGSRT